MRGEKPCWRQEVMDRVWLVLTPTHTPMPCRAAAKSPQLLFSSAMECNMPHPNPFSPADKVGLLWMRSKGLTRVRCKWMQFQNPPMLIHVIGWASEKKKTRIISAKLKSCGGRCQLCGEIFKWIQKLYICVFIIYDTL